MCGLQEGKNIFCIHVLFLFQSCLSSIKKFCCCRCFVYDVITSSIVVNVFRCCCLLYANV